MCLNDIQTLPISMSRTDLTIVDLAMALNYAYQSNREPVVDSFYH